MYTVNNKKERWLNLSSCSRSFFFFFKFFKRRLSIISFREDLRSLLKTTIKGAAKPEQYMPRWHGLTMHNPRQIGLNCTSIISKATQ